MTRQQAEKEWELSKYTQIELEDEIERRVNERKREAEKLYAVKDVIGFDENGIAYNTEEI